MKLAITSSFFWKYLILCFVVLKFYAKNRRMLERISPLKNKTDNVFSIINSECIVSLDKSIYYESLYQKFQVVWLLNYFASVILFQICLTISKNFQIRDAHFCCDSRALLYFGKYFGNYLKRIFPFIFHVQVNDKLYIFIKTNNFFNAI